MTALVSLHSQEFKARAFDSCFHPRNLVFCTGPERCGIVSAADSQYANCDGRARRMGQTRCHDRSAFPVRADQQGASLHLPSWMFISLVAAVITDQFNGGQLPRRFAAPVLVQLVRAAQRDRRVRLLSPESQLRHQTAEESGPSALSGLLPSRFIELTSERTLLRPPGCTCRFRAPLMFRSSTQSAS